MGMELIEKGRAGETLGLVQSGWSLIGAFVSLGKRPRSLTHILPHPLTLILPHPLCRLCVCEVPAPPTSHIMEGIVPTVS